MNRTLWLVIGIISILGGIFAFFNPLSATLAAEQLAGFIFLLVGVLQFIALFRAHSTTGKVLAAIGGVLGVLIGIELLQDPLQGILTLTMVIAILFMATGIVRVVVAFGLRRTVAFVPILLSGLLSIILAIMIFTSYPQSATYILGILLAVELISNGISLIMYSRIPSNISMTRCHTDQCAYIKLSALLSISHICFIFNIFFSFIFCYSRFNTICIQG